MPAIEDLPRDTHGHPLSSINSDVAALPRYRHPLANVRGVPLYLPRCGLTVIPLVERINDNDTNSLLRHRVREQAGWWACRVIDTDPINHPEQAKSTGVGGYDICVGYEEIATGVEVPWDDAAELVERLWPR